VTPVFWLGCLVGAAVGAGVVLILVGLDAPRIEQAKRVQFKRGVIVGRSIEKQKGAS